MWLRSAISLAAVAATACGAAPLKPGDEAAVIALTPQAQALAGAQQPAADPNEPVSIPSIAAPPPGWLEPPADGRIIENPLGDIDAPAYGLHTAIMLTAAGYFAVDDAIGVIGPLEMPEGTAWVGLGGPDDAVLATTADRTLHIARSVVAATKPGGFEKRGAVPGAVAWDAAGLTIVAAHGSSVSVSTDAGKTFKANEVARGLPMLDVVVRQDGVMAALATALTGPLRKTFISRDAGKSWQASAFQPGELTRDGSWLWNGKDSCPAVLSADGRQWTTDVSTAAQLDELDSWSESLILSDTFHPLARSRARCGPRRCRRPATGQRR